MSERAAYSQLASILMSPAAMGLGQRLGYGKLIPPTPNGATLPEIPQTDILNILAPALGRWI